MIYSIPVILSFRRPIGNVYIGDTANHAIRKVTISTGIISTIAGSGSASYGGDGGPATSAGFNWPYGVAVDLSGIQYTIIPIHKITFPIISIVQEMYTLAISSIIVSERLQYQLALLP